MKKILYISLLSLLTVSFLLIGGSSIKAHELEVYEKYSPYEDVYVPPLYSTEERSDIKQSVYNYDGDLSVRKGWTQGARDKYESNDDFSIATVINRTSTTYATLHTNAWWNGNKNDQDYFKFVTTRKVNFTLRLESIPSGCDYDVKIYDWNKQFIPGGGGYKSGNADEIINITLGVGTYYIHIFSIFDHNNDSDTYILRLNSSDISGSGFSLSSQNKSQYKAAVWTSHYFPNNIDPDNYEGEAIYSSSASHSGVTHTGNFDSFLTASNQASTTKYLSRILYVWGTEEKLQIANDLEKIYNKLGYYSDSSQVKLKLELSVGSFITAVISIIPGPHQAASSAISIGLAAASLLPSESSKRAEDHRSWLHALIVTLRTSADAVGEQVIRIASWYSCEYVSTTNPGSYGGGAYIYVKFHWTDISLQSLSYNSNYISSYQSGNLFYGDVTPVVDVSDFGKIFK